MGLVTVDVTPLAIILTSDSQPVDIYPNHIALPTDHSLFENHIVPIDLDGFRGFASFVGTTSIEGRSTRDWLEAYLRDMASLRLDAACRNLAAALTERWERDDRQTWLSIFVAGYESGEPRYWYVSNGGFPTSEAAFPRTFDPVNDLDDVWFPLNAQPKESKEELLARMHPSFRRGVMTAAAVFDGYAELLKGMLEGPHRQFQPVNSLDRYIAFTRFRFEFTKRMYDPKYGIGVDPYPPIRGEIVAVSIDREGVRRRHGKHIGDVTELG